MSQLPFTYDPKVAHLYGREYADLYAQRQQLTRKIKLAEQHFFSSLSRPLSDHLASLLQEDAQLLCKMIDCLLKE